MRKVILLASMFLLAVIVVGCNRKNQGGEENTGTLSPSPQPTVTLPAEDTNENTENNEDTDSNVDTENTLKVKDYYPLLADTEYVYQGEGNEYASYNRYTDFLEQDNNLIQTRTNNGGTETVRVIEINDGKVSVISVVNECYYRDNFLNKDATEDKPEVLLMEPLIQGTQWTLPDGRKRYISGTDVAVETPSGKYNTIEVTTEGTDSASMDYYAPQIGLVKSTYASGDLEIASVLSKINVETPFTQAIDIYYPDADEKIYVEPLTLTFRTNDITRMILQEALSQKVSKDSYLPLASINTKINSLYLGEDNIVYVDFTPELVNEMNAGAGYEALILQCITNTLGNYYGAPKVYITLNGKPYESGHIIMKKGEAFEVNMDNVVR